MRRHETSIQTRCLKKSPEASGPRRFYASGDKQVPRPITATRVGMPVAAKEAEGAIVRPHCRIAIGTHHSQLARLSSTRHTPLVGRAGDSIAFQSCQIFTISGHEGSSENHRSSGPPRSGNAMTSCAGLDFRLNPYPSTPLDNDGKPAMNKANVLFGFLPERIKFWLLVALSPASGLNSENRRCGVLATIKAWERRSEFRCGE